MNYGTYVGVAMSYLEQKIHFSTEYGEEHAMHRVASLYPTEQFHLHTKSK